MSRDQATPPDEQYAALLAAFDDALAGGAAPPAGGAPADLRPRLEADLECLHLLHLLRPEPSEPRPSGSGSPSLPDGRGSEEPGERYTPIRLHAAGGIGQVWLVHDADLDRDVALKELRTE